MGGRAANFTVVFAGILVRADTIIFLVLTASRLCGCLSIDRRLLHKGISLQFRGRAEMNLTAKHVKRPGCLDKPHHVHALHASAVHNMWRACADDAAMTEMTVTGSHACQAILVRSSGFNRASASRQTMIAHQASAGATHRICEQIGPNSTFFAFVRKCTWKNASFPRLDAVFL